MLDVRYDGAPVSSVMLGSVCKRTSTARRRSGADMGSIHMDGDANTSGTFSSGSTALISQATRPLVRRRPSSTQLT